MVPLTLGIGCLFACGGGSASGNGASVSDAGSAEGSRSGTTGTGATTGTGGSSSGGTSGSGSGTGTTVTGGTGADAGTGGTGGAQDGGGGDGAAPPAPKCGAPLPAPSSSGVVLQVDECASRHTISDYVYGITFFWDPTASSAAATLQFAKDVRLPLNRLGGDATTRYNWQVDSTNSGEDWYFMAGNGSSTPTPGASNDALVKQDKALGTTTVMTIPIIDYITKSSATNCSYPSSEYPNQDSFNPYATLAGGAKCGNGKSGGNTITDTHVSNHDIPNSTTIQQAWVQHLVGTFGTAANGGVQIYEMDNEPTGWPGVHFDVKPTSPDCTELIQKTQAYASMIKAVDATAAVLGPGDIAPADVFACGSTTNGQAYLAAMAAYEQSHGTRILDYYSMHYPGWANGGGDPIANAQQHVQTHLGWIAANYPGTKLGYDEYNWGDSSTFANALVEVDGLGLFGSAGVSLASFWGLDVTTPTATAFRMYRDYDGSGGSFGDVSIGATSSDTSKLHVYAAERASDGAVTIVVVNRTGNDVASVMAVSNHTPAGSAAVFVFASSSPTALVAQPPMTIADPGNIEMTFAANTATLIAIP
jgi:hypothetical protein